MADQFEDIRIISMDISNAANSDSASALRDVVLNLSAAAPSEWQQAFNMCWKVSRYVKNERVDVTGNQLIIYCVPEEIEEYRLPELQQIIMETNALCRQSLENTQDIEDDDASRG